MNNWIYSLPVFRFKDTWKNRNVWLKSKTCWKHFWEICILWNFGSETLICPKLSVASLILNVCLSSWVSKILWLDARCMSKFGVLICRVRRFQNFRQMWSNHTHIRSGFAKIRAEMKGKNAKHLACLLLPTKNVKNVYLYYVWIFSVCISTWYHPGKFTFAIFQAWQKITKLPPLAHL